MKGPVTVTVHVREGHVFRIGGSTWIFAFINGQPFLWEKSPVEVPRD